MEYYVEREKEKLLKYARKKAEKMKIRKPISNIYGYWQCSTFYETEDGWVLKIRAYINRHGEAKRDIKHELGHIKDIEIGKKPSELRACLYEWCPF